jgi:hypothetical protein
VPTSRSTPNKSRLSVARNGRRQAPFRKEGFLSGMLKQLQQETGDRRDISCIMRHGTETHPREIETKEHS